MTEPTKEELLRAELGSVDTERLSFEGMRGDPGRHLSRSALERAIADLPPAPIDDGSIVLLVARGSAGERHLPEAVVLTPEGGMPGDRWADQTKYGSEYQLATARADFARVVANGQPLELHGDNLFLDLDVSSENLPAGSRLQLGEALVEVTPQAHNGCKKWVQRFGLAPMQMNLAPEHRPIRLRGLYLRVLDAGRVRVGDRVVVLSRGPVDN